MIGILFSMGMYAQALLNEDFEGYSYGDPVNQNGWFTLDTTNGDSVVLWRVKSYHGNHFAEIRGFKTNGKAKSFLFTPLIDLTGLGSSDEVNLYYDVQLAYYTHQGLKVYAVTGINDPITDTMSAVQNATYDLLHDSFPIPGGNYGSMETYNFNLNNYKGQKIRIAFYYEGDTTNSGTFRVDNVKLTTYAVQNIDYVYTLNDTTLVVKYAGKLQAFDTAQFTVTGSNFGLKNIDLNDSISVYLYTTQPIAFDNTPDQISDGINQTSADFYAGIVPMPYLNSANTDTIATDGMLTLKGYVTANDGGRRVWIEDDTVPMHGIQIYDKNIGIPSNVKIGNLITVVGTRKLYYGLSEISPLALITVDSSSASPIVPIVINGSVIDSTKAINDSEAEPYESMLVKIQNVKLLFGPDKYGVYRATNDDGKTAFFIDDAADPRWDSYGSTFSLHGVYDVTGVINYSYGVYRINPLPKDLNGMVYLHSTAVNDVSASNLNVYPNPVSDKLYITTQSNINKVEIYNTLGQAVKSINMSTNRASVNVADLQPGVYMVRILTNKGTATSKIIKR